MTELLLVLLYSITALFFGAVIYTSGVRVRNQVLEPIALFGIFYPFGHYVVPLVVRAFQSYRYQTTYSLDTLWMGWLHFTIFGIVTLGVYYGGRGPRVYERSMRLLRNTRSWVTYGRQTMAIIGTVLLVPMLGSAYWLYGRIQTYGWAHYMSNRIVLNSGTGYQMMPLRFGLIVFMIVFSNELMRWIRWGRKPQWALILASLVFAMGPALLTGGRSGVLIPTVFGALTYVLLVHNGRLTPRRFASLAGLAAVLLIVGVGLGSVRDAIKGQRPIQDISISTATIINGVTTTYGEFENLFWLLENKQQYELLYGETFASVLAGFVPRAWWPNKPLGGGPHLRNFIKPGSYDLQAGRNLTSYTTGLVSEAYMNFGLAGTVLIGSVYGIVLLCLSWSLRLARDPLLVSAWIIILYRSVDVLNAEVFGIASHVFSTVGPILVLRLFLPMSLRVFHARQSAVPLGASKYTRL